MIMPIKLNITSEKNSYFCHIDDQLGQRKSGLIKKGPHLGKLLYFGSS